MHIRLDLLHTRNSCNWGRTQQPLHMCAWLPVAGVSKTATAAYKTFQQHGQ
jgi:hypothetical protein